MRPLLGSRRAVRSFAPGRLAAAALVALVALAACGGGDSTGPDKTPVTQRLDIIPADSTVAGFAAKTLGLAPGDSAQMAARVNDSNGGSTAASALSWSTSNGAVAEVTQTGLIRARANGAVNVIAQSGQYADTLRVTVSACGSSVTVSLAAGQAQHFPAGQGSALCVTGAEGDEYVLVAFNTDQDSARVTGDIRSGLSVTGHGIASLTPTAAEQLAADAPNALRAALRATTAELPQRDAAFDRSLRARAGALRSRLVAAHERAATGASLDLVPSRPNALAVPTVGQLMSLNTSLETCDTTVAGGVKRRTGRVVAITDKAIIVADTANPAGGFTETEYRNFGVAFDTLAYPVDVANFGGESDVDKNGRSIIFFTSAVNAMTPRNADYYVGGFFYERDLFQNTSPKSKDFCGGSNYAEMFYMLVPDPTGRVNGNVFRKGFVDSVTVGTLAHEFQHLINASRRIYVNDTDAWEDTWLNEGLSHIAEELVFDRAAGLTARTRLDSVSLAPANVRSAFNYYMSGGNIQRLASYFVSAETSSPYSFTDDLETRGATWAFLRYAADRVNGADATLWQKLVRDTKLSGVPNLRAALGLDATTMTDWFRDWTVANFADGYATSALESRLSYRSWNFRSVMGALKTPRNLVVYPTYPLQTRTLTNGRAEAPAIRGGTAAYFRFAVGSGKQGRIITLGDGAKLPANVAVSVVRTR